MQIPSRQTIQRWSFAAAQWLLLGIVIAFVGEWVNTLAREHGYFNQPSQKVSATFGFLLRNPLVHLFAGAILGFASGVWVESFAQRKDLASAAPQPTPTAPSKPDPRTATIADAKEMVSAIRHALENRDDDDAIAFYDQFTYQAIEAMETLMKFLNGIPPANRSSDAPQVYWKPRTVDELNMVADDLELLANAVKRKVRSV